MAEARVIVPRSALLGAPASAPRVRAATPCVAILPPTSDFSFAFRAFMLAHPLAQRGIASVLPGARCRPPRVVARRRSRVARAPLPVIPYYATRKPHAQFRACLLQVSDLFSLGAGVASETSVLFNELEREFGFGPFGVTGLSLGGYLAAQLACVIERDLACVPIVLPRSARCARSSHCCRQRRCALTVATRVSLVFTRGVLSTVTDTSPGSALSRTAESPARRAALLRAIELGEDDFAMPESEFDSPAAHLLANVLEHLTGCARWRAPSTEYSHL